MNLQSYIFKDHVDSVAPRRMLLCLSYHFVLLPSNPIILEQNYDVPDAGPSLKNITDTLQTSAA